MALKLVHATKAQQQAAFDVVFPAIIELARHYARQTHVPFVDVERVAVEKLSTEESKQELMRIIDKALDAAETVEHGAETTEKT